MEVKSELLNHPAQCRCQQVHHVPIDRVAVGNDVTKDLIQFLNEKRFRRLLVVADANTDEVFGAELRNRLLEAGFLFEVYTFTERHDLLPDEAAVAALGAALKALHQPVDTVLAVGSGVINDIVRYVACEQYLTFISIPTAPSMDGYASNMAAMQFNGMKLTTVAKPPLAIFAELKVLQEAPFALIQSGFGDLVGKVTSLSDWLLSSTLFREYFCPEAFELVYEPLTYVLKSAEQLNNRDQEAVKNLFIGLINSGIAMAMVGNSRPCSGSEHHCSHFWDLLAYKGLRPHGSHGLQVGYATYLTGSLYRYLLRQHRADEIQQVPLAGVTDDFIGYAQDFYGAGAHEVISSQREKVNWVDSRQDAGLPNAVETIEEFLEAMTPLVHQSQGALQTMGIVRDLGYLGLDIPTIRYTLLHARELRSRFTILDLLAQQGWLDDAIEDVLSSFGTNDINEAN